MRFLDNLHDYKRVSFVNRGWVWFLFFCFGSLNSCCCCCSAFLSPGSKSQVQFCVTAAAMRKAKGKDFEIQPIEGKGMAAVALILGWTLQQRKEGCLFASRSRWLLLVYVSTRSYSFPAAYAYWFLMTTRNYMDLPDIVFSLSSTEKVFILSLVFYNYFQALYHLSSSWSFQSHREIMDCRWSQYICRWCPSWRLVQNHGCIHRAFLK